MAFFLFNSEMQSDCSCLSVRHHVYDTVSTASVDGWIWMFLYWLSSSHLSLMQRLKASIWKVILLWQPHDSPFHYPKSPLLHYKENTCLVGSKGQKCDWENLVSKTVQRKRKLYFLPEPTWFSVCMEVSRGRTQEVMGCVKRGRQEKGVWSKQPKHKHFHGCYHGHFQNPAVVAPLCSAHAPGLRAVRVTVGVH